MNAEVPLETQVEVLQNDLNTALGMLADWCVSVDVGGIALHNWVASYDAVAHQDGPLRGMLDAAIQEAYKRRGVIDANPV